jgi:hypothetical protein
MVINALFHLHYMQIILVQKDSIFILNHFQRILPSKILIIMSFLFKILTSNNIVFKPLFVCKIGLLSIFVIQHFRVEEKRLKFQIQYIGYITLHIDFYFLGLR